MYQYELVLMCEMARKAGEIALTYWNTGLVADTKADESPVTVADRETERAIAAAIEAVFPEDGLLGEEGSQKPSRSGRLWIIDPIDGTRDFVRGNRAWATLVGLEVEGEVVAGVAYMPAMGELFHASRGSGAFCNEAPIGVSTIGAISQAVLCVNGFNNLTNLEFSGRLIEWMTPFWAVRSMGGCLDAMMVARGQADLWIEPSGKPWDFAAPQVIVEEAGGRFFNFDGGRSIYGGNCVLCAPGMEAVARDLLQV